MLKLTHALFIIALASPLHAAPISTWSGAGPNACHGRCSLEWAVTVLTPSEHEQLVAAMIDQPDPVPLFVHDGAVFSLSTYFKDGAPHAYRTTTIAVLDEPEPAMGWELDGWTFARLQACDNWTIITDTTFPTAGLQQLTLPPAGVAPVVPASYAPLPKPLIEPSVTSNGGFAPFPGTNVQSGSLGNFTTSPILNELIPPFVLGPDSTPMTDVGETLGTHENLLAVPLPSSFWLLLASVLGLVALRLRSTSHRMMSTET